MHRQPEHVIQFLFSELGTTGSVDGEKRLVIKGRFQQKQLENVLRRYIGMNMHSYSEHPLADSLSSGIRHMQDLQVPRHAPYKGEPTLFHGLRSLRVKTLRQRHQDWFPGASGEETEKGPIVFASVLCFLLLAYRLRSIYFTERERKKIYRLAPRRDEVH